MSFTQADVARVARLARLGLRPDEEAALAQQLAAITAEFESLAGYAASLPEPAAEHPGAARPDAPDAPMPGVLAAAPRRQKDGTLRAPKGGGA